MDVNSELPKIVPLSEEETNELKKYYKGKLDTWVLVGDKKWFLTKPFTDLCSIYYNFVARPDDTWVVTFPRSGTTWTQEMVWLLSNELDYTTAKSTSLKHRFPYVDDDLLPSKEVENDPLSERKFVYKTDSMASPRFIKTHLPLSLMPNILKSGCKIIYVARNPKDNAISYYHFLKNFKWTSYDGDFETFWHHFKNALITYGPYWNHIKEGWAQRHRSNVLFLFYEEMTHDLLTVVRKVATFLGKSYSESQYRELVEHLKFSNMKENNMVNISGGFTSTDRDAFKNDVFIRQGKSQAWHSMFSPELNAEANRWIQDNLNDTDLQFPFIDIHS